MSASGKLKALGEGATRSPWMDLPRSGSSPDRILVGPDEVLLWGYDDEFENPADPALIAMLRNALPQIVAVVEADEAITLRSDVNGMPPRDCGYVRLSEIDALRAALAALEEALS